MELNKIPHYTVGIGLEIKSFPLFKTEDRKGQKKRQSEELVCSKARKKNPRNIVKLISLYWKLYLYC